MTSKKANLLGIIGIAAAMSDGSHTPFNDGVEDYPYNRIPRAPIPPKGTKEYFFNEVGEFSTEQMLKTETVFMCYAINDKNATRKFKQWQKLNQRNHE